MMNGKMQIPINPTSLGICKTICSGLRRASWRNIVPVADNQHCTAFLVIYETDTDRTGGRCLSDRDNPKRSK